MIPRAEMNRFTSADLLILSALVRLEIPSWAPSVVKYHYDKFRAGRMARFAMFARDTTGDIHLSNAIALAAASMNPDCSPSTARGKAADVWRAWLGPKWGDSGAPEVIEDE